MLTKHYININYPCLNCRYNMNNSSSQYIYQEELRRSAKASTVDVQILTNTNNDKILSIYDRFSIN